MDGVASWRPAVPWWVAGGAVAVVALLLLVFPVTYSSGSSDTEREECGSPLSTLSRRLDRQLVEAGDVSPGPGSCERPLADRGASGVAALVVAVFVAATGFPARRWQGLVFPVVVGGVLVWHLAWPLTLGENDERSYELRCGSPALTSTSALDRRAVDDEQLTECAAARGNRLARAGLVAVLGAPLVLASISRRDEDT